MTDKEYREIKARLRKAFAKWHKPLGFGWWNIDLHWERTPCEDNHDCAGLTSCNWQYRTAAITLFVPAFVGKDDEFMEDVILHELVHILIFILSIIFTLIVQHLWL